MEKLYPVGGNNEGYERNNGVYEGNNGEMKERNGRGKKKGKTLDGKGNRIGTKMRRERQSNILPETRLESCSFCVPHVVNHRTKRMKK